MTYTDGPIHERSEVVGQTPIVGERVRTASATRFAPDALIAAAVGLVTLVTGLLAIVRAGIGDGMTDNVVHVAGYTHTNRLGVIEIGLGVALLASGAARSRVGAMFFGTVLGVAGFVGAVQSKSFATTLGLESSMGWLAVIASAVVVFAAVLLPRFERQATTVQRT